VAHSSQLLRYNKAERKQVLRFLLTGAFAGGLAGTAVAAPAHAGSDVVRGEIESNRPLSS